MTFCTTFASRDHFATSKTCHFIFTTKSASCCLRCASGVFGRLFGRAGRGRTDMERVLECRARSILVHNQKRDSRFVRHDELSEGHLPVHDHRELGLELLERGLVVVLELGIVLWGVWSVEDGGVEAEGIIGFWGKHSAGGPGLAACPRVRQWGR